jgi:outer membrane receptor for ferrienterochelin and colicins
MQLRLCGFWLVLFLFSPLFLRSQARGVVQLKDGSPLAFATIQTADGSKGTLSEENGAFVLEGITVRSQIIASFLGYESDTLLFEGKALTFVLKEKTSILDEVVVSGTLREVSRSSSPVPIEIYTPAFFRRNPSPNLFNALENINGVRPQVNCNVCNTGDIHINGMEGPYTMILIDGMPIVSSLATVYGLMGIPNSMVQRIEVVKGPASTLYGSEAVGGLINVITKQPGIKKSATADITFSNYRDLNADFGLTFQQKKHAFLLSTNLYYFDTPWDINGDNFTDMTLQKRFSAFGKWTNVNAKYLTSSLAARYVHENRWGGQLQWTPAFRGGDSIYAEQIYTDRVELIGQLKPTQVRPLQIQYSYNFHSQNSVYGTTAYIGEQHIGFGQTTWSQKFGRHDLLGGVAMRFTWYDDNTPVTASPDSTGQNKPSATWLPGVFYQHEFALNPKTTWLGGIRLDYNTQHGPILSPRLNLKWAWNEKNTLRLGLGNGFRVANVFSEDHAALTGAREVVIARDLKPEQSINAFATHRLSTLPSFGTLSLESSLFYTYFTNRIIADYFTNANQIIFDNLSGHGIARGVSITADASFLNGWSLQAGTSLMEVFTIETEAASGATRKEVQIQTPSVTGNWSLSVPATRWNLTIDYTGTLTSPMRLPVVPNDYRPEYSPWFSIHNLQLTWKARPAVEVYGGVKNLFNFIPDDPILRPFDPFDKSIDQNNPNGYTFDPNYNYAPMQGVRAFGGIRISLL